MFPVLERLAYLLLRITMINLNVLFYFVNEWGNSNGIMANIHADFRALCKSNTDADNYALQQKLNDLSTNIDLTQ